MQEAFSGNKSLTEMGQGAFFCVLGARTMQFSRRHTEDMGSVAV